MEYLEKKEGLILQNKIIFDICGTLYDSNTTMDFCEYRAVGIKKKILKLSKTILAKVINKLSVKFFNFDLIRMLHIRSLKDLDINTLQKDANDFVEQYLEKKKIDEVHNILKNYDKNDVILVSATIEPLAKAIAKKLGNLNYIATSLNYENNICKGTIKEDLLGNKQKYFQNRKIDFIITDNKSDLELCKLSKEIVIVTKKKNILFWQKQNINVSKIIEVN
jgi:phosphoserine phosphatase